MLLSILVSALGAIIVVGVVHLVYSHFLYKKEED